MSNEFEPNQETTPLVRRTLKQYARIVSLYSENLICLDDSRQSAKAFIENHLVQIIPSKSTRPSREQDGHVRAIGVSIIVDVADDCSPATKKSRHVDAVD